MAKSSTTSKAQHSISSRQLAKFVEMLSESQKSITPIQLAQLAVAIAHTHNHPDPRIFLPKAQQVLIAAERYSIEGISGILEHAKSSADIALITSFIFMPDAPVGWERLLAMLNAAVRKRSGRANRVLTQEEVWKFLAERFPESVSSPGLPGDIKETKGESFLHHLDQGKLSQEDAQAIVTSWQSYRKEQVRGATVARKAKAAAKRLSQKK